jgi:hypothetical protein
MIKILSVRHAVWLTLLLLWTLPAEKAAGQDPAGLHINEFMASNVLAFPGPDSSYTDWIEIFNSGEVPVDLAGCSLSDNMAVSRYWRIPEGQPERTTVPANGFRIFFADGNPGLGADHLGFSLNSDHEQVILIDRDGATVLDSISYRDQLRDVAFGRWPDGAGQWYYLPVNTPGTFNLAGYPDFSRPPEIDQDAGFYPGGLTVTLQPFNPDDQLYYTLDGSDPGPGDALYGGSIPVQQTSVLRVRSIDPGFLPGPVTSRTFFTDIDHSLPVLVLITDPANLYDPLTGIYVNDYDGREWERFAELEYFRNEALQFHVPCGIRIQGNTGPADFYKKSFRVFLRAGYGAAHLNYPFYRHDSVQVADRVVLRAGYDDSMEPAKDGSNDQANLLRDPVVTELWRRAGGLTPQSSFTVLYLNNEYHGIYDIKQSIDENFVRDHLGYRDIDLMRTRWDSTELVYGSRDEWQKLVSFFQDHSFTSDALITEAGRYLDLDNFITLQALMHAAQYRSWAYGAFMFREKTPEGVWQWTIWDADRAYTNLYWNGFTAQSNPLGSYLDGLITKKLIQNMKFRNRYINRISDLLNTTFSDVSVMAVIDSLAGVIAPDIPDDVAKWGNTVAKWEENVDLMKDFAGQRPDIVRSQMQSWFGLAGQAEITLDITGGSGRIGINSVIADGFPWSGKYFLDIPVTLTALPDPGYRFERWSDPSLPAAETITIDPAGDLSVTAVFRPLGDVNAELIIPDRISPGRYLPVVMRIRDIAWAIDPIDQTPVQLGFEGIRADTTIQIKRGAGTAVIRIDADSAFGISARNSNLQLTEKPVRISTVPVISYSGTLPAGDMVWDSTADRLITDDVTVLAGTRLVIEPGTWVIVRKNVNFHITGQIHAEGTPDAPVVITADNWSEPWGGMEFRRGRCDFRYCFVLNGGGDMSKGHPTTGDWHTGHQHIFFGQDNSEFTFDNCFFMYSPGKVFGMEDSRITVTNSVTAFVWHGGEFHRTLLSYRDSHLLNLPNDDHIYTEDIDTDGFHIDYVSPQYPQYSVIDRCYFVTGKDDAIDHHYARLRISNCWLEDFIHEGVAASGGDTVKVFNTVALNNDQGFEAGWTESGVARGPYIFIDHCVAVGNHVGLRIGDSYTNTYHDYMQVTNSVIYGNDDNIWNYLLSTRAPLPGALDISWSMTNDADFDTAAHCITGEPLFDDWYYLQSGSPGSGIGMAGTDMGRADSSVIIIGPAVINEIMHNAPGDMDTGDWIELSNPQPAPLNVSGWLIRDDTGIHSFAVPEGAVIPAGGFLVVCADTAAFRLFHPDVEITTGNIPFGFGSSDQVRLFTSAGLTVDSVAYTSGAPWPDQTDGQGKSLELVNPAGAHTAARNWSNSVLYGGSPGRANHLVDDLGRPATSSPPLRFDLKQNYPNPFNPLTRIEFSIPQSGRVKLSVYDLLGRKMGEPVDRWYHSSGIFSVDFDASALATGIYFYQLRFTDENGVLQSLTRKMVFMK